MFTLYTTSGDTPDGSCRKRKGGGVVFELTPRFPILEDKRKQGYLRMK